jgi:hypothetical protein
MPIRLTFDSSVPSVVADSLSDLVDRANASGVYASGDYRPDLTFTEPSSLPFSLKNLPQLSGFTSSSRHIYLNPEHDGDRPVEDRFLHELTHVLHPGIAAGSAIGPHPLQFYEKENRLYTAIGRAFEIRDSVYQTDSERYAELTNPGHAPFALTRAAGAPAPKPLPLCLHERSMAADAKQVRALLWVGALALGVAAALWFSNSRQPQHR